MLFDIRAHLQTNDCLVRLLSTSAFPENAPGIPVLGLVEARLCRAYQLVKTDTDKLVEVWPLAHLPTRVHIHCLTACQYVRQVLKLQLGCCSPSQ